MISGISLGVLLNRKKERDPSVIFYDTDEVLSPKVVGGKAFNSQKLGQIPEINTAPWFVLTAEVFRQYLIDNKIDEMVEKLDQLVADPVGRSEQIDRLSGEIQEAIHKGSMSDATRLKIEEACDELRKKIGEPNARLAVRSSGVIEDGNASSCAGLYETVLNRNGNDQVIDAIQVVWASSFNPLVVEERIRQGVKQSESLMGVMVQKEIDSRTAGVISTIVLSNYFPGIQIAGNFGLGESVVGGEVGVDVWVVHPKMGYTLERIKGEKEFCYVGGRLGGVEKENLTQSDRNRFVLTQKEVRSLADQALRIKKAYQCEVDVEYAVDQAGKEFILQARPLKAVQTEKMMIVDPVQATHHQTLARGLYSVPGVTTGRLVFVSSWNDLASGKIKLTKDDIVLAYVTTNTWSQYLSNIKGLITREGSPSSHPILLSREKRIPCVIGIDDTFENLVAKQGSVVTVDGMNKVIYEGEVAKKEANTADLMKQFEPIQLREWPDLEKSLPHLLYNKMAVQHEGKYWRRTPTYPLVGFQKELNMLRFSVVPELITNKEAPPVLAKVIDGYTCNEIVSFERYVSLLDGMGLREGAAFNAAQSSCMREFMKCSEQFTLDPEHWRKYINTYARFRSYIWLGGAYRAYAERKVDELGIKIELPSVYLDETSQVLQAQIPELDAAMSKEIHECAKKFKDRTDGPEFEAELQRLSSQYRFEHAISLDKEADLSFVRKRVIHEIDSMAQGGGLESSKHFNKNRELLPDAPELREWLRLSILNRILQSDSHHLDARAKMFVRPKLLELGAFLVQEKVFKNPEQIFDCSVDEVAEHMRTFQKKKR